MTATSLDETQQRQAAIGLAILRVSLGLIIIATWWSNVTDDPNFYSADGLRGFFDWVAKPVAEGGNGASLGFVHSIITDTVRYPDHRGTVDRRRSHRWGSDALLQPARHTLLFRTLPHLLRRRGMDRHIHHSWRSGLHRVPWLRRTDIRRREDRRIAWCVSRRSTLVIM